MLFVHNSRISQRKFREGGFTLIEVLVTFVILAVGVLGIVSLLSVSKTSEYEAVQRARAVTMADGMLERVRNNPGGLVTYVTGLSSPIGVGTATSEPTPNCISAPCTPVQLATHDLWKWEQVLRGAGVTITNADDTTSPVAGLTEPRGCVTFAPWGTWTRSGQLSVLVQWRGLQESTDGVASGEPACGSVATDEESFRRRVTVSTFVVDETEL